MRKSLRHFWEFRIIKPYKIIILIGALAFGRVEDVMGQRPDPGSTWVTEWGVGRPDHIPLEIRETLFSDMPAVQFTAGAHVGAEWQLGRFFAPFVDFGFGKNINGFEINESMTINCKIGCLVELQIQKIDIGHI